MKGHVRNRSTKGGGSGSSGVAPLEDEDDILNLEVAVVAGCEKGHISREMIVHC